MLEVFLSFQNPLAGYQSWVPPKVPRLVPATSPATKTNRPVHSLLTLLSEPARHSMTFESTAAVGSASIAAKLLEQ